MNGYLSFIDQTIEKSSFGRRFAAIACAGLLAAGVISGCGSDNDDGRTGTYGGSASGDSQSGEVTPDKNAPDSAGDKKPNAPDNVIGDKPGSSAKPVEP